MSYAARLRLDGKAAIVLGVGEGIGRESVRALADAGARVVCVDRDPGIAEETAALVDGIAFAADVTKRADMEALFRAASEQLRMPLTGVVDVVGMSSTGSIPSFDDAAIDRQFEIVFRHAVTALQIGGPLLARGGGGAMTFIGSTSGLSTSPGRAMYGAAKAALHHLVRYAANEFGRDGVRVNAVAPGYTRTPRLVAKTSAETWRRIADANPLGRAADPSDIASVVLFLTSDLARYVNGNVLVCDGGTINANAVRLE